MKLYLIHCGFYDSDICDGLYESHVNFFTVAENFETARNQVKALAEFKRKKMHIDGLQELQAVNGYDIHLNLNSNNNGKTILNSNKHRELAPKKPPTDGSSQQQQ